MVESPEQTAVVAELTAMEVEPTPVTSSPTVRVATPEVGESLSQLPVATDEEMQHLTEGTPHLDRAPQRL